MPEGQEFGVTFSKDGNTGWPHFSAASAPVAGWSFPSIENAVLGRAETPAPGGGEGGEGVPEFGSQVHFLFYCLTAQSS